MQASHGHTEGLSHQSALDFSQAGFLATGVTSATKDRAHAVTSGKMEFQKEASQIGEHTFSIKLSYMGRSFLLTGNYRRERLRSYADPTYSSVQIWRVHFDTIQVYQNDRYISKLLSKSEITNLENEVHSRLANPFFNTTLGENETVH